MSFCCRNCIRIRHRHHQVGLGCVIWLLYLTLAVLVNVFFLCLSDWGRPVVSRVFKRGPRTSRLPPSFFLCHLMTTQVIVISLDYKLRVGTKTLEWIFASADWVGLAWPGWLAGWLACCSMLKCMWFCIVVVIVVVFNMISIQTSSTVNGKVTRLQRKEEKK